jgi:CRP/FNR family cyclic AMP-dependent transcriptional regulator
MERRTFNSGDTIFKAGDDSDRAFMIVVGGVDAMLPNGRKKRLGPGEIFGEMGLIDSRPRSATVVAAEYTVCAAYSEAELLDDIRTKPDEAIAFIRALIARLRDANEGASQASRL